MVLALSPQELREIQRTRLRDERYAEQRAGAGWAARTIRIEPELLSTGWGEVSVGERDSVGSSSRTFGSVGNVQNA